MAVRPYLAAHDGSEACLLADGDRTSGRLAVVARDLAAGATRSWQRAIDADLAYLVVEGAIEFAVADRRWTARPLTLVGCPRGAAHRYRALTAARLVVLAAPGGLEPFLLHGDRLAATDPALFLALAQEHRVEVLPDLLP